MKLSILLSLFVLTSSFSQEDLSLGEYPDRFSSIPEKTELNKNAVHAVFGFFVVGYTGIGYYERILSQKTKNLWFFRGAHGETRAIASSNTYATVQIGGLIGGKNSYMEAAFGPLINFANGREDQSKQPPVSGTLNYRYQEHNFVFRSGFGWPEGLFLSLGISF